MTDEGYIKFDCDWTEGPPPADELIVELNASRRRLFELGLIGFLADEQVDFGNISIRGPTPSQMIITGTQTGHLPHLSAEHYARVTACDIDGNRVACEGAIKASSETLTHAAIYALSATIQAVIHVHSAALWEQFLGKIPTTAADTAYGTPAMAREFQRLYRETGLPETRIAAMGGHPGGLISFGASLRDAENRLREKMGSDPI